MFGVKLGSGFVPLHEGCPALPAPFTGETGLSPFVCSWLVCCKLIDHVSEGLFLGSLFCSTDQCVCFYARTTLFWLPELCNK